MHPLTKWCIKCNSCCMDGFTCHKYVQVEEKYMVGLGKQNG